MSVRVRLFPKRPLQQNIKEGRSAQPSTRQQASRVGLLAKHELLSFTVDVPSSLQQTPVRYFPLHDSRSIPSSMYITLLSAVLSLSQHFTPDSTRRHSPMNSPFFQLQHCLVFLPRSSAGFVRLFPLLVVFLCTLRRRRHLRHLAESDFRCVFLASWFPTGIRSFLISDALR